MLTFFKFISVLLNPFLRILLQSRLKKGLEAPHHLQERYGITSYNPSSDQRTIWFHAASVGETLSLIPVVTAWKKRHPTDFLLITTTTCTAAQIVADRLANSCFHQYAPFDVWPWVDRFLNTWMPQAAIFVESEIWPYQFYQLHKRKIPLIQLNAKLSEKSLKRWKYFPRISQWILSKPVLCLAQGAKMAATLHALGCKNVEAISNLKFMAPALPVNPDVRSVFEKALESRPSWIAASTHPGEEEIVITAHKALVQQFPALVTFLIPRHPNRTPEIEALLIKNNICYQRRSNFDPACPFSCILVDTLGEIGLFYSLSPIVFLGGSLVPIGGHNVIEPALFKCATIWGPYTHKTQDLADIFGDALITVQNGSELTAAITLLLSKKSLAIEKGAELFIIAQQQSHNLSNILNKIENAIS